MKIKPFKLERYFAKYEFSTPFLLSSSDCEPLTQKELLALADADSMRLWESLWLGYTESKGNPKLISEITKLYKNISDDEVLVVVPEEGIFIAMNTLLKSGDEVVITYPGYQSLYQIAESLKCNIKYWKPKVENGEWKFSVDDLEELVNENTKLLVMNFPHNPTGATLSTHEQSRVVEVARRNNTYIFSDEMYRYLEFEENVATESISDIYENSISLFGVSKTFSLAGLRIGWLTTQNADFMKSLENFKDYTTICNSAPSEVLSIIALRNKQQIINRNKEMLQNNLQILDEFFTRQPGKFAWYKPKAGSIAFPKLLLDMNVADFALDLVEKQGVMILPSNVYDFEGNYFRLGFGRKNFPEALDEFEKYLSNHT